MKSVHVQRSKLIEALAATGKYGDEGELAMRTNLYLARMYGEELGLPWGIPVIVTETKNRAVCPKERPEQ